MDAAACVVLLCCDVVGFFFGGTKKSYIKFLFYFFNFFSDFESLKKWDRITSAFIELCVRTCLLSHYQINIVVFRK
jgi:hypothetical protein